MMATGRQRWNAVVIGAGPAGAVAARLLALGGASVLLVDRKAVGRDKVCGCCWSASGLELLGEIGAREAIAASGVRLSEFALYTASGDLQLAIPNGLAVCRTDSDAALVRLAVAASVTLEPQMRAIVGPVADGRRIVHLHGQGERGPVVSRIEADVVIAADGLGHSSLANLHEFSQVPARGSYIGAGRKLSEFPAVYDAGTIYMALANDGYVGMVVLADGSLNVAAALSPALVRREGHLARAAAKVLCEAGGPAIPAIGEASWSGTPLLTRRATRVAAERIFLLGDSAGYTEPFTGEGMTWAVLAACAVQPLARQAMHDWKPAMIDYWTLTYQGLIGRRQRVCRRISGVLRSPLAVGAVTRLLNVVPGLGSHVARFVGTTPAARAIGAMAWQRA
jgi:flavin-dependent dehydrogenase